MFKRRNIDHDSGVYIIKQKSTNKVYVGSAVNIFKRWLEHFRVLKKGCHHSILLQRAFDKSGHDDFVFIVIEFVCENKDLLNIEQYWIDKLHSSSIEYGFNINKTAGNRLGTTHSEESKQRMSNRRKGVGKGIPLSNEHKLKISKSHIGIKASEKTKNKMSDSAKLRVGRPVSNETKEKIRAANIGTKRPPVTQEHRQKLSIAAKSAWAAKLSK